MATKKAAAKSGKTYDWYASWGMTDSHYVGEWQTAELAIKSPDLLHWMKAGGVTFEESDTLYMFAITADEAEDPAFFVKAKVRLAVTLELSV